MDAKEHPPLPPEPSSSAPPLPPDGEAQANTSPPPPGDDVQPPQPPQDLGETINYANADELLKVLRCLL